MSAAPWPAEVAHLPVCPVRGLPIPYSSGCDADGAGQFGRNDPVAKLACGVRRLCGVCGRTLGDGEIVFLVADSGRVPSSPVFPDPPNHQACATAAMGLCPRIARPGRHGWLWWITDSYELVPGRRSLADFLPGPAIRITRFAYAGGQLREVASTPPDIDVERDPACDVRSVARVLAGDAESNAQ
jgi:hypothetical protein